MGKLKKICLTLVVLALSSSMFAKQISIQIVQRSSGEKASENAMSIEDNILNGLFDSGFIVTNSPAVTSISEAQDKVLWADGFGDAYDGSSDYFVQVTLFSEDPEPSRNYFTRIDMSVVSVSSGNEIKNTSMQAKDAADYEKELRKISASIISEIKKAIKA